MDHRDAEKVKLLNDRVDDDESQFSDQPVQDGGLNQPAAMKKITSKRLRRRFAMRRRTRTIISTGAIMSAVLLERITYFSIIGNLVLFCTNTLKLSSTLAVTINLVFTGNDHEILNKVVPPLRQSDTLLVFGSFSQVQFQFSGFNSDGD